MKRLFVKTLKKARLNKSKIEWIVKLLKGEKKEKQLNITYSIQYYNTAKQLKKELEKKGFKINKFLQVLGCTKLNLGKLPILHIGSGRFHALNLAGISKSENILIFDSENLLVLTRKDIENYRKKHKVRLIKYFASDNVGILISVKYGQQDLKKAIEFKKRADKTKKQGKKHYLFLCNNINTGEFENFNNIKFWINTACPRLEEDSLNIINIERISE